MKIHWATESTDSVANALGYNTHNKYMRKYSEPHFEYTPMADMALQITPADHFRPLPGYVNVLFTMWEFLDLPQTYIDGINKADMIIVPCSFCKEIFQRYTDKPIYVCWEGIEPEQYPFKMRSYHGGKFRFLWVGAPNIRKGYPYVLEVANFLQKYKNVEIYVKTTAPKVDIDALKEKICTSRHAMYETHGKEYVKDAIARIRNHDKVYNVKHTYGKNKNIILDTRLLSRAELLDLYYSAHCFLLPTFGEGWGLTLCEAMATGCPSIAPAVTGCADYFDNKVGYELRTTIEKQEMPNYDLETSTYVPDTEDLLRKMLFAMHNYSDAAKRGQRASERMHNKFTWERSGIRLKQIMEKFSHDIKLKAA